jgi:hypothetical protein
VMNDVVLLGTSELKLAPTNDDRPHVSGVFS